MRARAHDGGTWGQPTTLDAGPGDSVPYLAVDGRGEALLVWSSIDFAQNLVAMMSASRSASGTWGAPTRIDASQFGAWYPSLAMAAGGSAIAAWLQDAAADGQTELVWGAVLQR